MEFIYGSLIFSHFHYNFIMELQIAVFNDIANQTC